MSVRLKPIEEQVIVITGASSGIGLATARMAAERGARVMLAARDGEALARLAEEIRNEGGQAAHAVADVADETALRAVADAAVAAFGGFDTWVNNAGVSIYGRYDEVSMEDHRRLFETNYWGVVAGSRIAAERLSRQGGAIVTVGSSVSDRALPLQGAYSASKHAVKGFTDALRMELEASGAPVSVTLIKPGAVDTQYESNARNYMDSEPNNPPPVYAPELVAEAILHAAETPVRDLFVGGGGRLIALAGTMAPRLTDRLMERYVTRSTRAGGPVRHERDALHGPSGYDGSVGGDHHGGGRRFSVYTTATLHPWTTLALFAGLGAVAAAAWAGRLPGQGHGPAGRRIAHARRRLERHRAQLSGPHEEIGHEAKPAGEAAHEGEVTFAR